MKFYYFYHGKYCTHLKRFFMNDKDYFLKPTSISHKKYEALRMYFVDDVPAGEVAIKFGYTYRGFTTLVTWFRNVMKNADSDIFFLDKKPGRKRPENIASAENLIIQLRLTNHSVPEIKTILDSKGYDFSEKTIYNIQHEAGFKRLPRRSKEDKQQLVFPKIEAEKSASVDIQKIDEFKSDTAGILCLLPFIESLGIRQIIEESNYPGTKQISKLSSILSFVALKASDVRRYTADNIWCMDRGSGLFAGLNVLPKAAWFTSYSDRVTSDMNKDFLIKLSKKWIELGLISDTVNLDFTTIPYWGDSEHLENNWSGKRNKALPSMLAVLAQDQDSGIVDYGDTNIMHKDESAVILEFLDFYKESSDGKMDLKYLVFDSKFTNYENLNRLNKDGIKFLTIRRRGKNIVEEIENLPQSKWKTIRIDGSSNKKRTIKVCDQRVKLRGYEGEVRQIVITGNGKIKPAIIITNDFESSVESLVRKYARRWLVEKEISEQISFFHLNNVSSSMVIKVDFDLTMSILTHNIYRLLARDLPRFEKLSIQNLYEKFLLNSADIQIEKERIIVNLKKKRNLPLLLESMNQFNNLKYAWLGNKKIIFKGATYS